MIKRVFFAAGGPGDIIDVHESWKQGNHYENETSITFSSQIEDFCAQLHAKAYLVSPHPRVETVSDGPFTLEHRPKPQRGGVRYHLTQVAYGIGLLATAVRFRADVTLLDSGCTHYFVMSLFRIFGIHVVPILHNSLWPIGSPPTRFGSRLALNLSKPFWRRVPSASIIASPALERQIDQLAGGEHPPVHQMRAQFLPERFDSVPPPPPHDRRPFQVMFIGRITRSKGVFDILEVARRIEESHPGLVRWEICGLGPDFDELKARCQGLGLQEIFHLRGWTSPQEQVGVYESSHASIVPSRSDVGEGLAMTAVEAILAGRPVITNPVTPALEVLRPACVEAKTDDIDSHMEAVLSLATDPGLYQRLCRACPDLRGQFYDRGYGLTAVLLAALAPYLRTAPAQVSSNKECLVAETLGAG